MFIYLFVAIGISTNEFIMIFHDNRQGLFLLRFNKTKLIGLNYGYFARGEICRSLTTFLSFRVCPFIPPKIV